MAIKNLISLLLFSATSVVMPIGSWLPHAFAQSCEPIPSGTINWWPGNDSAKDFFGSNNGIVRRGAGFTTGKVGRAFAFDGVSGAVDVPDSPRWDFGRNDFTIDLWVNFTNVIPRAPFVSHDEFGATNSKWVFWYDELGHDTPAGPALRFVIHPRDQATAHDLISVPWNPGAGRWRHVAVSREQNVFSLYIDGAKVAESIDSAAISDAVAPFQIGAAERFHFSGALDEVDIFNRALSSSEILALYTAGSAGKCLTGPSALYLNAIDDSSASLNWDSVGGAKAYRVERKDGDCGAGGVWSTRVDTIGSQALDISLAADTLYSYRVSAYFGGSFSFPSACVSMRTGIAGAPTRPNGAGSPAGVTAKSNSDSVVVLEWADDSTNETSFNVYRKAGSAPFAPLATLPANSRAFRDRTAIGNTSVTSYAYDILACNAAGCSRFNSSPLFVPFAPTALAAAPLGSALRLTWTDASATEASFEIQRKNGDCASSTPWTRIGSVASNTTSFLDSRAVSTSAYAYRLLARSVTGSAPVGQGYSSVSNCVRATAP